MGAKWLWTEEQNGCRDYPGITRAPERATLRQTAGDPSTHCSTGTNKLKSTWGCSSLKEELGTGG